MPSRIKRYGLARRFFLKYRTVGKRYVTETILTPTVAAIFFLNWNDIFFLIQLANVHYLIVTIINGYSF